jgi:hypothetical protein
MAWKDFWFGAAAVLGAEFLIALLGVAVAILRSERATKKLLEKAKHD